MTSFRIVVKMILMKKLSLYIFLVLMFSVFTSQSIAWEKVPVPDYVDKKTKSPWNFYDDFEDQKVGKLKLKKYQISNYGAGRKPFKIKQEENGNKFLEISVEHGWNKCCFGKFYSERAELEPKPKSTLNKEIWYGFRLRFPENFVYVNDRLLVNQFKHQFKNMKKSPLMGIQLYWAGDKLTIGGDTGGRASVSWNHTDHYKFKVENIYLKKTTQWETMGLKRRENDEFKIWKCEILKNNKVSVPPDYCNKYKSIKFNSTPKGEWSTYKIGIKNSDEDDGFMKVFKDDVLIMNYQGITFDGWKGNYTGSHIRIGPYRDTDPSGKGYPPQSIHYDDFIVVSDKKTLDKYLK